MINCWNILDCDKSVAIEIKHDDKLPPEENVYIQIALLYTSSGGQRRLRVMNLALKTCTQLADLFRSCDLDTTILFFAKQVSSRLKPKTYQSIIIFFLGHHETTRTHSKSIQG